MLLVYPAQEDTSLKVKERIPQEFYSQTPSTALVSREHSAGICLLEEMTSRSCIFLALQALQSYFLAMILFDLSTQSQQDISELLKEILVFPYSGLLHSVLTAWNILPRIPSNVPPTP